jgi:serine/threonine protein kinase
MALAQLAVQTPPLLHRDVAARNVLVMRLTATDAGSVHVQLSDYGMARQGDSGAYYAGAAGAVAVPLPVRWMAPEALTKSKYSEKSDVWAFGVLMWELWAAGELPYYAIKGDEELIERVAKKGLRLARPEGCPEAVYAVMQRCWELLPAHRPIFQELQGLLMEAHLALGAALGASAALQRLQETADSAEFNAQQAAQAAAGAEAAALRR